MKITLLSSYILFCLVVHSYGGEIINSPSSETVQSGEFANFTCTVGCTDYVEWLLEGYTEQITNVCSASQSGLTVCKETTAQCDETAGITNYIETLHVMVANAMGAAVTVAVQCASISNTFDPTAEQCIPSHAFSRFAVLSVEDPPTTEPPPETTPTPVVCPSPTTVEVPVTTTETQFFTTTATIQATVTVTEVVMVTETPTIIMSSRAAGPRRRGLSVVLSELLTWFCTLLAGLLFL